MTSASIKAEVFRLADGTREYQAIAAALDVHPRRVRLIVARAGATNLIPKRNAGAGLPPQLPEVVALIRRMRAWARERPLTAILRPYRNPMAPDLRYRAAVLTDLFADSPGHGVGTAYMEHLCRTADALGVRLYTDAQDIRSRDFYLRHGFEVTTGRRDHQLVRWEPSDDED